MASISGVKSLLFLSSLILVNPISQAESTMDFNMSTQAKSWTFDEESLSACKQRAVATEVESSTGIAGRVRKFASGFHRQYQQNHSEVEKKSACTTEISCRDQEILVQFHAHQIQFLVGPTAILTDLRTSETVLSTAITFFRRFYLSNSIVEVSPRKISAACAFFAAKVEDEKVEVRKELHGHGAIDHGDSTGLEEDASESEAENFVEFHLCNFISAIFLPWVSLYVR